MRGRLVWQQGSTALEVDSRLVILEEKLAGGTTAVAPWVENYLGFQSINGVELAAKDGCSCQERRRKDQRV